MNKEYKKAKELVKAVKTRKTRMRKKALQNLEERCFNAVNEMLEDGETAVEVELEDKDLLAINDIVEIIREHGFRHRFNQYVEDGIISKHSLLISMDHLV